MTNRKHGSIFKLHLPCTNERSNHHIFWSRGSFILPGYFVLYFYYSTMIYGKLGNPICQTVGCFDLAEDGKTKCDFCVDTGLEITRWQHIEVEFEALKE